MPLRARPLPRTYRVSAHRRRPLLEFMAGALEGAGCRLVHVGDAGEAPFRLTFETPLGERMGILAYAFLADVVAACLHSVSERWEFRYARSAVLTPHRTCEGKLSSQVRVDAAWTRDAALVLREAAQSVA